MHVAPTVVPAGIASGEPVSVDEAPPREHATAEAGALPPFWRCSVHVDETAVPCVHASTVTLTLEEADIVPYSPKMKPATATPTTRAPTKVQTIPKIKMRMAVLRFLSFSTR